MELALPANNLLQDKRWRLNNLYKIRSKNKGITTFKFNSHQEKIFDETANQSPVRHFTLKTRQVGLSTFWLLYWMDDTMFNQGTVTGILAHKAESLSHLESIITTAINNFPGKRINLIENNKTRITFPNQSSILISLEFRSTPLKNLHISEWCFCDNDRIWATQGAISKWTNITGETTGNGMGNDGYLTWMDAKEGKNDFNLRFIPWFEHDEYSLPMQQGMRPYIPDTREKAFNLNQEQIHFRRSMMTKLKSVFFIEYPETEEDAFASSGLMFFNSKKIGALIREAREYNNLKPPIEESNQHIVWEEPQIGHRYVIGADTAEGVNQDYSYFKIICLTCRTEAMAYRAHIGLDAYYRILNKYGREYNRALLSVERNNHGHAVLLGLREDCHYPNLYMEEQNRPIVVNLSKVSPEPKYGWNTTANSKIIMLDALKMAIEGDSEEDENNFQPEFVVRDPWLLSECLTFQRNGVKLEAAQGKNDDAVMGSAIAYQMYLKLRSKEKHAGLEKVMIGAPREFRI